MLEAYVTLRLRQLNNNYSPGAKLMINTSIASLAVLKVNCDKGHEYVDNFVPFALEAISKSDSSVISVSAVQTYIKDNFGLQIPQGALNTILRRIAGQGYLQK